MLDSQASSPRPTAPTAIARQGSAFAIGNSVLPKRSQFAKRAYPPKPSSALICDHLAVVRKASRRHQLDVAAKFGRAQRRADCAVQRITAGYALAFERHHVLLVLARGNDMLILDRMEQHRANASRQLCAEQSTGVRRRKELLGSRPTIRKQSKTVASEKQIAASRTNAKRSTGPRTAAGKLRSSRNAYRHGLTCQVTWDRAD